VWRLEIIPRVPLSFSSPSSLTTSPLESGRSPPPHKIQRKDFPAPRVAHFTSTEPSTTPSKKFGKKNSKAKLQLRHSLMLLGQFNSFSFLIQDPLIFLKKNKHHASHPPHNWPDSNKQDILNWLLFPDVQKQRWAHLCAWHINKKILRNLKKHFPPGDSTSLEQFMKLWNSTTHSKTMESYKERLSEIKKFLSKLPAVIEYLKKLILPLKEYSFHSGDLLLFWKYLCHAVDHQISHPHEFIGKYSIKTLTHIPRHFFSLPQEGSKHARIAVQKKLKILEKKDLTEPCFLTFFKGSRIPCSHMIGEILEECEHLEPEYFHPQWLLDHNPEFSEVQEDTPEFYLKEELACLHLILDNEHLIFGQFHQILASTHISSRVQAPEVKEKIKGRLAQIQDQLEKDQKKFSAVEKKRKSESIKSPSGKKLKMKKEYDREGGNYGNNEEESENEEQDEVNMKEKDKGDQNKVDVELDTFSCIKEKKIKTNPTCHCLNKKFF
ncbi:uncharacterized protein VP01_3854g1, partial [Puccinia sorghi]